MNSRFEVIRELGRGGEGRVLEVLDRARDQVVAYKEASGPRRAALAAEFRLLHRLSHPHLVRVHDFFAASPLSPDASAYTLERVDGIDIVSALHREPSALPRFTDALLQALAQLHAAGVAHLDLKPDNILIEHQSQRVRLIDFGIAHPLGTPLLRVLGSRSYLAPELVEGIAVAPTADLFGLGVILAECLFTRSMASPSAARALADLPLERRREALRDVAHDDTLDAVIELAARCLEPETTRPRTVAAAARLYGAVRRRGLSLLGPSSALALVRSGGLVGREDPLDAAMLRAEKGLPTFVAGEGRAAFVTEVVHRAQLAGISAERWPVTDEPTTTDFLAALGRGSGRHLPELDEPDRLATALFEALADDRPRGLLGIVRLERVPLPVRRFFEALAARPDVPLSVALVIHADTPDALGTLTLPLADEAAVRAFVRSRFGAFPNHESLVRWLHATAAGSFAELEALSELLVAKGHLTMGEAGWSVALDGVVVRGRIPERLATFSLSAQRAVAALSVVASPVPRTTLVSALAEALDVAQHTVVAALDELEQAGWFDGTRLTPVVAAALPHDALDRRVLAAFHGRAHLPPPLSARVLASVDEPLAGARHLVPFIEAKLAAYQVEEAKALCQLGLELSHADPIAPVRLDLLRLFAKIADLLGPREAQRDALEALLTALADREDDEALETRSRLFWTKTRMGDPSFEAEGHALRTRAGQRGRHILAAEVAVHLAIAATQRGAQDAAETLLHAAEADVIASGRAADEPEILALAARIANNLGNVALYRQDHAAARHHYLDALEKKQRQGDPVGERIALGNLALTELELGRPAECLEALIASREIARATGHRRGEAWSLLTMAELGLECGAWTYAERRARMAIDIAEALGDTLVTSDALATLAEVLFVRGEPAAGIAERAAELAKAGNNHWTALRAEVIASTRALSDDEPGFARPSASSEDDRLENAVAAPEADPATRRLAAQHLVERRFARGDLRIPAAWSELLTVDTARPGRLGLRAASAWRTGLRVLDLVDRRAADRHRRAAKALLDRWLAALPATPLDDGVDAESLLDGPCLASAHRSPALAPFLGTLSTHGQPTGPPAGLDDTARGWEDADSARIAPQRTSGASMAGALVTGDANVLERTLGEALTRLVRDLGAERGFVVAIAHPDGEVLEARDTDGEPLAGGTRRLPDVALETAARLADEDAPPWRGQDGRGALCVVPAQPPIGPERAKVAVILQNRFVPDAFMDPTAIADASHLVLALTRLILFDRALVHAHRARDEATQQARAVERESTEEIRTLRRELESTREQLGPSYTYKDIIYTSGAMKRMLRQVDRVMTTELPVHIHGESGTGKELIARAIHDLGPRGRGPFVPQNCTAIPPTLFESELFGHERGSFTGAVRSSEGLFRRAHLGTLFLDEIGDLPLELQAKLLRVLETGEVRPVGATRSLEVDVRVVSATHRDLKDLITKGAFREDLYYRLNVIRIEIPPLRDRPEDILVLARHFLAQRADPRDFDDAAKKALVRFPWPGNVRQLENEVSRAALLADGTTIGLHDLSPELSERKSSLAPTPNDHGLDLHELLNGPLKDRIDHLETIVLKRALEANAYNKSEVARTLGLSRAGLNLKLKRLGLWDGE